MDEQLRSILKEKMESLSVKDIAPAFNARQTWNELSPRVEKKERRLVPVAWAYAAALVLGILIGGAAIYHNLTKEEQVVAKNGDEAPASKMAKGPSPEIAQPKTADSPPKLVSNQGIVSPVSRKQPKAQQVSVVIARKAESSNPQIVEEAALFETPAKDEVATTIESKATSATRAMHLLDIADEARTALLNEPRPKHSGTSFTLYISPNRLPEGRDVQAPASVLHFIRR